ncbi:MFS transporter [Leucobacter sp. M11]|uniref:MFS transporter n=1 Tax=Leucobacter sp. M11 TaxID=2993565 RepID=UPI002D7F59C5|nr:MFS transporter [Leucobacter sp. M11]MEB4615320.1 MFS transporter [Leucobacter sp. M11]
MTPRTPAPAPRQSRRVALAIFALAIGSFGIGTTEFVAMGLLPDIARDLLPELAAANPDAANAQAGWLITLYALGVVVGAPTIAAIAARWPRRTVLVWLAVAFTVGTLATALLPTFETVLIARFLSGLPHGAYFGLAALVAAELMGPGRRGRGITLVMTGLTVSNMVGVPLATVVGQHLGWRAAFIIVAGIFALTAVAVRLALPDLPGNPGQTVRRELEVFRRPQVWFATGIGAIGFGGFFAVYSYLAPLGTEVSGLAPEHVPWLMATMGLGMTLGTLAAGRLIDRSVRAALFGSFAMMILVLALLLLIAGSTTGIFIGIFLVGIASSGIGPAVQTRLMDVAGDAQSIAAALNHSAMNLGNASGAFFGGLVVAAGLGYLAPLWVGIVLTALGIVIAAASFGMDRRLAR